MNCELRKIKVSAGQSQETIAFTGELFIDGKRAAHLSNSGRGEPILAYFEDPQVEDAFYRFCSTQPAHQGLPMNPDFFLDLLVADFLQQQAEVKAARRAARTVQLR